VYSQSLVQKPWVPTPDDPKFATWDPATDDDTKADRAYFPEMVSYMDKTIGKIITKVQEAGLSNNTIIMFISDNATNKSIDSRYKGQTISGSKDSTTFNGINVPFLIYAPGIIAPGTVDTSLVDMTDFFPTLADIAKVGKTAYQPLDGTTFYDNILGSRSKQRSNIYCYWPRDYQKKLDISYVLDKTYKLYDSLNGGYFYNVPADIYEQHPIPNKQLTTEEKKTKNQFRRILRQGFE
jgi:arylsulfatase A